METYSPEETTTIVGSHIVSGFADGEMVKAGLNNDEQSIVIGSDGSGARVISADKSGFFEIMLKNTSPSNQVFSDIAEAKTVVPIYVKDGLGGDLATCKEAIVQKRPDMSKGKEITTNVWRFTSPNVFINHGGNE